jgi:tetratricopeptide (TPR) repeat protein
VVVQKDDFALALAKQNAGRSKEAAALYRGVLANDPTHAYAYHNLGLILAETGRAGLAIPLLWYATQLMPELPDAHNSYGNVLMKAGKREEAEGEIRKAINFAPQVPIYRFNLANLLSSMGRHEEAEAAFREAIRLDPNYVEALNNLGNTLRNLKRPDEARRAFEQVLAVKPGYAMAHNNIGNLNRDAGALAEAEANYLEAIRHDPKLAIAYFNLGNVLRDSGRTAEAASAFRKAIELEPRNADAYRHLVQVERLPPEDGLVAYMQSLYENALTPDSEKIHLSFALGRVFDQSKKWDDAFRYFEAGNKLHRKTFSYDIRSERSLLARIGKFYSAEKVARMPGSGIKDDTPVFIIGMIRSGTTLIEQILASHPAVEGGGELPYVQDAVNELYSSTRLPFPDCTKDLTAAHAKTLGEEYLSKIRGRFGVAARRITDKMPQNFLYGGLISQILPEARFIYMKRNPLDVALSAFGIHFTDPHPYAYDLAELGQYCRFSEQVMAHWIGLFGSKILVQPYEALVENYEAELRKILDFLELPFDPACLEFYKTQRSVATASASQVREKLNANSIGRWKPYERHLRNLKAALAAS